ncbi:MAG: hypothetical protein MH208_13775 [Marinobacter sp.]|nr:hypothetical protein [Marinobacter sp.]
MSLVVMQLLKKSRAILASLVGAVVVAKSISDKDEQHRILEAAQKQILNMLGVKESELATIKIGDG